MIVSFLLKDKLFFYFEYKIDETISSSKKSKSSEIYPTTVAVPLSCLISPISQQQSPSDSTSFAIDLKPNEMNFVLTPSSHSQPSISSDTSSFVLTLGHLPYKP